MNNPPADSPFWTIVVLGAATLLVVSSTQRTKPSGLLAVLGLLGMIAATIGSGIRGSFTPPVIIAALTSFALLISGFNLRRKTTSDQSTRQLSLALCVGLLAIIALVCSFFVTKPSHVSAFVFDAETQRAEQRAILDVARLDLEILLSQDISVREQTARDNEDWELLEAITVFRNRTTQLRENIVQEIELLELPYEQPLPEQSIETLIQQVRITLEIATQLPRVPDSPKISPE